MLAALHFVRWWDWCMQEDEKKEIKSFCIGKK